MFRRAIIGIFAVLSLTIATQALALGPIIVFFERGSVRLTPQAEAVLDNAGSLRGVACYIAIGHSDREGSPARNLILSRQRALAVRNALAARGIAVSRVRIEAYGESRPLVETRDGVAEAQNRRVEVITARPEDMIGGAPC